MSIHIVKLNNGDQFLITTAFVWNDNIIYGILCIFKEGFPLKNKKCSWKDTVLNYIYIISLLLLFVIIIINRHKWNIFGLCAFKASMMLLSYIVSNTHTLFFQRRMVFKGDVKHTRQIQNTYEIRLVSIISTNNNLVRASFPCSLFILILRW